MHSDDSFLFLAIVQSLSEKKMILELKLLTGRLKHLGKTDCLQLLLKLIIKGNGLQADKWIDV